eukprot:11864629-Heterocapsa_arctica.AAC.1
MRAQTPLEKGQTIHHIRQNEDRRHELGRMLSEAQDQKNCIFPEEQQKREDETGEMGGDQIHDGRGHR